MAKTLVANVYIEVPGSLARGGYGPIFGNQAGVPNDIAAQITNPGAWVLSAASEAEMLALSSATVDDVVIRTDLESHSSPPGVYVLTATPASTLGNWTLLNPHPPAVKYFEATDGDGTSYYFE